MDKHNADHQPQRRQPDQKKNEKEDEKSSEEIPLESSPYLNYKDLEDYKNQAYGAQGHIQPKPGRGAGGGGATDAPTLSGDAATSVINRHGVPW